MRQMARPGAAALSEVLRRPILLRAATKTTAVGPGSYHRWYETAPLPAAFAA